MQLCSRGHSGSGSGHKGVRRNTCLGRAARMRMKPSQLPLRPASGQSAGIRQEALLLPLPNGGGSRRSRGRETRLWALQA